MGSRGQKPKSKMQAKETLGQLFQLHLLGGPARDLWIQNQTPIKLALISFLDTKIVQDQVVQTAQNYRKSPNRNPGFSNMGNTFGGLPLVPRLELRLAKKEEDTISVLNPLDDFLSVQGLGVKPFWEAMEFLVTDRACLEPFQVLLKDHADILSVFLSIREEPSKAKELWLTLGFNLPDCPKPLPTSCTF